MHILVILSCLVGVLLGFYVLYAGDWTEMHLKRAAVMLSTTVSLFLMYFLSINDQVNECETSSLICASFHIYFFARSCCILLFQWSCGRDAINYKNKDRRGNTCRITSLWSKQAQH